MSREGILIKRFRKFIISRVVSDYVVVCWLCDLKSGLICSSRHSTRKYIRYGILLVFLAKHKKFFVGHGTKNWVISSFNEQKARMKQER